MRLIVIGSIFLCFQLALGHTEPEKAVDQPEIVNTATIRKVDVSVPALLARCTQQVEQWSAIAFDILNNVLDYRNYWQEQQLSPSRYFWRKNPLKWFSEKPQECEITENITFLEKEISHLSTKIGDILLENNILKNIQEEKKLSAMLSISLEISNHLNSRLFPLNDYKPLDKDLSPEQILELMNNNIAHYAHYKKVSLLRIDPYKGPGHFTSNWINYSLAGIGLLAAGKLWQINHQHLLNKIKHGSTAAQHFYSDYVKKSLIDWWNTVYHREDTSLISEKECQIEEKILEKKLYPFFERKNQKTENLLIKTLSYFNKDFGAIKDRLQTLKIEPQETNMEEIQKLAHDAVVNDDYSIIEDSHLAMHNNFFAHNPVETFQVMSTEYQRGKVKAFRVLRSFDEKLKRHLDYLTAPCVAFILLGCSFLSYKIFSAITYDIYGLISPHKIWVYRPIQRALIEIEALLNRYNKGTQILPVSEQGMIHYWLYKISQSIRHIPHHHQLNFNRDINELASYEFSIPQKISIINRMQRSYSFLMPHIK